uniref:Uncharacterized protein n=1 Tax=Chlamydomonas leiostraca TaxID=1034604 RepID=A0A7S0R9Z2_9CHLO
MNDTGPTEPAFVPEPGPPPEAFNPDDGSQTDSSRPFIVIDPAHQPTEFTKQFYKFSNVIFSSATVALMRTIANRSQLNAAPANSENLPKWYLDEYKRKSTLKSFGAAYLRDTAILTAASYLMDGVTYTLEAVRGTEDALNKTVGGLAAGSMVSYFWFPTRPQARAIMGGSGALVGYVAYNMQQNGKVVLLEQQKKLEEEVGVPSVERRAALDPPYLRELVRLRQKQLVDHLTQQQQQGQGQQGGAARAAGGAFPGGAPGMSPFGAAGAAGRVPGAPGAPGGGAAPFAGRPGTGSNATNGSSSRPYTIADDSGAPGSGAAAAPAWAGAGSSSDSGQGTTTAGFDGGVDRDAAGAALPAPGKRSGWGGWFGGGRRAAQQHAPSNSKASEGGLAPAMEIREEVDTWDDGPSKDQAARDARR